MEVHPKMSSSSKNKGYKKFSKADPSPENQPDLSPTSSSNEKIPRNPCACFSKDILGIYLTGYVDSEVVPQGVEDGIINRLIQITAYTNSQLLK